MPPTRRRVELTELEVSQTMENRIAFNLHMHTALSQQEFDLLWQTNRPNILRRTQFYEANVLPATALVPAAT